ncbi:ribulose bisphosphate carboxylase/oxygenase activase, chloroplastic-like [Pistacia vera]|uniref:ribulose bisphosphate carboxylase/oxygenase activase, chloroplastic-like n=1 Tax=Pistacia vera TaxID=55513 RepID=UPI00126377F4|nr:ribulose bisphosphate carboxylase/oxygenase activase, chloroplastic-like [Pistacia vera]
MENGQDQDKQSSRSKKRITIHDYVQSGDVDGFQKLLQENPSLLNERNAIMLETPLHLSAGNNKTEILKFLLEWKGDDKIDLEAKTMCGETPLHLAAKNGCNEAARLLVAHGALVEAENICGETPLHLAAKHGCSEAARLLLGHGALAEAETEYGATPLKLSVLHSIRTEDCSIVKTLLENNADYNAKDDEGMTVLDHLSKIQESGKLHDVFLSHQEEQRKKKVLEACSKEKETMDALDKELSNIVGLDELKTQLRKWAKSFLVDERRKALGLIVGTERPPHMIFLGNPGTGKTMVARILGRLLHSVGILHTSNVKEVQRADLVGEHIGHTGPKTREKIKEAEGGILFVDEAYRLIPGQRCDRDFGLEALEEIMSCMESGKVLVIFAGYNEPMQRVISSNEGFSRRATNIFKFKDLSCEELANLLHIKMSNQAEDDLLYGFKLHSSCSENAIAELIQKETTEVQRRKMNGGLVDIMLNNAKGNLDFRITDDCVESDELFTIKLEDFEAALRLLPK